MSELKVANVRQCLDILKDFYDAKSKSVDAKLQEKAGRALEHLDEMFAPDPGTFSPICEIMQVMPI